METRVDPVRTADAARDVAVSEATASLISMQTDAEGTGTWSIHDDMAHTTPECARQELLPGSVGYVSVDSHSIAELKPQTYSPVSHMETQTLPGLDPSAQGAFDWKAKATELEAALHEAQETLA